MTLEDKVIHPTQPLRTDEEGVVRFKGNAIIQFLLQASPFDMNMLAMMPFDDEDRRQFTQLIGYSESGFYELFPVENEEVVIDE